MDMDYMVPTRRRSARILQQEVDDVANDGRTDYKAAFSALVSLGRELGTVMRILESLAENMGAGSSVEQFHSTLDAIDDSRRAFTYKYPAMFRIGQCRDLYVMLCARIQQSREILEVTRTLPPETLSASAFASLPVHTPEARDRCSVCCESGSGSWVRLPCGHAFHRECAEEWLTNRRRTCPLCREEVT